MSVVCACALSCVSAFRVLCRVSSVPPGGSFVLYDWDGAREGGRGRTDDGGRTARETDSTRTDTGRETEDGEETGREITTAASRQATRPPRPARSTTHVSSRRRLKAAIEIVHRLRNRVVLVDIDRRPDALATIPPAHPAAARTLDAEHDAELRLGLLSNGFLC